MKRWCIMWSALVAPIFFSCVTFSLFPELTAGDKLSKFNAKSYKIVDLILSKPNLKEDRVMSMDSQEDNEISDLNIKRAILEDETAKSAKVQNDSWPIVINTWAFTDGTKSGKIKSSF